MFDLAQDVVFNDPAGLKCVGSNSYLSATVAMRCASVCGGSGMEAKRCLKAYTERETCQLKKKIM